MNMRLFVIAIALFLLVVGYLIGTAQTEVSRAEIKEIRDWKEYKNFCEYMKRSRRI